MRKYLFAFAFLSLFALSPAVFAQGPIEISPLIMELEVDDSKSYLREVVVKNKNTVDYEVTFEAFDVEIEPGSHNVQFLPIESKQNTSKSLAAWIVPEGDSVFVLSPGQQFTFRFRFSPPAGTVTGDYYGSLNFYYKPVGQQQNGNVTVRQSLGCLLLVSLNGGEAQANSSYNVSGLMMSRQADETEISIDFANQTLRFIHLKPLVTLKDSEGEIYFQREGRSKRVFPGETATVLHSFPNVYLAAEKPLTMYYALWDKQGTTKYYEEVVPLDSLRLAPPFEFAQYRLLLLVAVGVLLILLFGVHRWRIACQSLLVKKGSSVRSMKRRTPKRR